MLIAPGERFLDGFIGLLADARVKRGPFSFLSGRSYVSGLYHGRDVMARLQLKRSRYGQGYLVVAMRLQADPNLDLGSAALAARTTNAAAGQARSSLDDRNLELSIEAGWLKALWQPQGLVIFPGPFSPETWTSVLDAMATLERALAAGDFVSPPRGGAG